MAATLEKVTVGTRHLKAAIETAPSFEAAEHLFPSPVILSGGRRSGSRDTRFEVSIRQ
jgi:hypothetical protein